MSNNDLIVELSKLSEYLRHESRCARVDYGSEYTRGRMCQADADRTIESVLDTVATKLEVLIASQVSPTYHNYDSLPRQVKSRLRWSMCV